MKDKCFVSFENEGILRLQAHIQWWEHLHTSYS